VEAKRDCWADWIARMRPGSRDGEGRDHPHWRWRDRILDAAEPIAGEIVLDVGCGEGLVAFGALERDAREAVFSDISDDLLEFCRAAAAELGLLDRCRFVRAAADDLSPIADATVDVVTTRSVLIYVADKGSALREFARVLRPGGRISIFEPINRFARTNSDSWAGYDLGPILDVVRKVRAIYERIQPPETDPMLAFDERDLIRHAEEAGFTPIRLQLEAEIRQIDPLPWEEFVDRAANPRVPTLVEAMHEALTTAERDDLVRHLRPLVEKGRGTYRTAIAFLSATKA